MPDAIDDETRARLMSHLRAAIQELADEGDEADLDQETVAQVWARMVTEVTILNDLLKMTRSLRERVLFRLIGESDAKQGLITFVAEGEKVALEYPSIISMEGGVTNPKLLTKGKLMKVARVDETVSGFLSRLPFTASAMNLHADPELPRYLQDLAQILAHESSQAGKARYYPGVPEVERPSNEHVEAVMEAMQREIDRESMSRRKENPLKLAELPFERQLALTERRRYWYGQYGITPESWKTGVFSLWDVSERDHPDYVPSYDAAF